ncbi:uncharacterized protein LOC128232343 [Mya arenaria]|uniref:uncharacterized protein LOC128232343 n=1 Tax=Mya arenaria TaxID=6604 RepID=UPI0022DF52C9|nr:uncharacterized protein LOC128232343 [Mya arenaria]
MSRVKKLTYKAMEIYNKTVTDFNNKLQPLCDQVIQFTKYNISSYNRSELHTLRGNIEQTLSQLKTIDKEFQDYSRRTNTEQSNLELSNLEKTVYEVYNQVDRFLCQINTKLDTMNETSSIKSGSSSRSRVVSRKLAKAEAAKAKVVYAQRQAELMKQEAHIKAELFVLKEEKEAAAALAEAEVLEREASGTHSVTLQQLPFKATDKTDRVLQFVEQTSRMQPDIELPRRTEPQFEPPLFQPGQLTSSFYEPLPPFNTQPSVHTDKCDHGQLSKFMLKKDLLLSRLYKYDDRPETFPIWKQSFQTVLTELDVTPVEELDLLLKWLGTKSRQYAVTIRAANIHDLPQGVKRIWGRLEERYGTPEQIESTLSKKLSQFPNLTNKDKKKLYELADIAAEIESLKENPRYSALLAVYDSSSGVNKIVMKLPHSLREKWVTRAAKYKAQHEAVFPPFKELVKFLNEIARIKNNPGLMFDHIEATHKTLQQKVFSRKTEVNDRVQSTHGQIEERPQEKCPIHKTKHSLRVCNAFKAMNQENKKQLLKENQLCFRCLSPSHMYKNCNSNVKCEECGSDRHCMVMHFTYKPRESHGGEETKKHVVASKSTRVCENAEFKGKSCAKLVLVNVYKKNRPQNQIKVYAMIDVQSNRSLAGPELFDLLDLNATMTEYTLGSCSA